MRTKIIVKRLQHMKSVIDWQARRAIAEMDARFWRVHKATKFIPGWAWLSCLLAAVFLCFVALYHSPVSADSQGPLSASSTSDCVDDNTGTIGTVAWTGPGNAFSQNTTYASASVDGTITHYIKCTNFSFSIPSGSTIDGIVVGVDRKSTSTGNGGCQDAGMRLVKTGSVGTTDRSTTTVYPTTDTYEDHGSSSDLWGDTWTTSDINASTFGAAFAATKANAAGSAQTVTVDHIRITVYYTLPPVYYDQASYRVFGNQDASTSVTYAKSWGTSTGEVVTSSALAADGSLAVTGYITNGPSFDAFIAKYDASSNLMWSQTWGDASALNDQAFGIASCRDGGFVITGVTSSFGAGSGDLFINKYTSTGTLTWSKTLGGTSNDQGNAVVQTTDGGYAVAGSTNSFGAGGSDAFIVKFDTSGTLSWNKAWGGASTDQANAIAATSDGGVAVTGMTASFAGLGTGGMFLLKYDSAGTLVMNKTWGGSVGQTVGQSVIQTSDGGYAVAGYSSGLGSGSDDMFLVKYDSSGAVTWNHTWGEPISHQYGYSLIQTSDSGYAVAGATYSFGNGAQDVFLVKYDVNGSLTWNRTFGGTSDDVAKTIRQTPNGNYVVGGYTFSYGAGNADVLQLRFDSSGTISGCGTICTTPSATVQNPTAVVGTPSATTTTPSATSTAPSGTVTTPSGTTNTAVAMSPSSIDVSTPLAAQNTAATIPGDNQPFRLRIDIGISNYQLLVGSSSLKLQYAPMTTSCDASFTNTPSSAYKDVTDTSIVRYYDNTNAINGMLPSTNANDPTDSTNTLVRQTYQEKSTTTFSNPTLVPVGQDAVWDFALTTYGTLQGTHYCLRLISSSGSTLTSYTTASSTSGIAEIITPGSVYTQSNYRIFQAGPSVNTFLKAWGGLQPDYGYDVIQTSDGGYAVAGTTFSFGDAALGDMFLAKYDSAGSLIWNQTWGGGGIDTPHGLIQTSTGDLIVVGGTTSFTGGGGEDMYIVKYNSSGTFQWNKMWGGSLSDEARSVVQTTDGNYVVTGQTNSFGSGSGDMVLVKYTTAGVVSWNKVWGGSASDIGTSLVATSDGGVAVTGQTQSFGSATYAFLAKYDSSGTLSWSRTWGGHISSDYGSAVIQTSDGGYAVSGTANSFGAGGGDGFIAKYDSSGTLSWSRAIGGEANDSIVSITQISNGDYIVAGNTSSFGAGGSDTFVAQYSSTLGAIQWFRTWGSSNADTINNMAATIDGGVVQVGDENSFGAGSSDVLFEKLDASAAINGCSGSACNAYAAILSTPAPDYSSPTATTSSPTATATTPTATTSSPAATTSTGIANGASASVGSALTTQNQKYDIVRVGSQFRLRLDIDVSGSGTATSGQSFKLQYAVRGSDLACDTSFSGETYSDVTTTTPVYYYDGSGNASGDSVHWSVNDPTSGSNTLSPQTYQESNNFTNSISNLYSGASGEWDFSLAVKSGTLPGNVYCLRVVKSDGTTINYSSLVDIAYGPFMTDLLRQEAWFNRVGIRQNFWIKGQ